MDATAPQTTIDSGPDAATSATSASFRFSADEQGSKFECALDGGAFRACDSPREYTGLAAGNHKLDVRATDTFGNVDATPATRSWTITPPRTTAPATVGASADSWVLQSSATSKYGTDSTLKVGSKSGGNSRALVRFNLPTSPPTAA